MFNDILLRPLIKKVIKMNNYNISNETPIALLTVGQFLMLSGTKEAHPQQKPDSSSKRHVYGIKGIADTFNCSLPTAHRIKASGKIDEAITQIGRKIIVDADLALELAGRKNGGRKA